MNFYLGKSLAANFRDVVVVVGVYGKRSFTVLIQSWRLNECVREMRKKERERG